MYLTRMQKTFLPVLTNIMPKQDEIMVPLRDCALILLFYTFVLRNMNCDLYAIQGGLFILFQKRKTDQKKRNYQMLVMKLPVFCLKLI